MTLVSTDRIAAGALILTQLQAEVGSLYTKRDLDLESWRRWEQKSALFKTRAAEFYAPFDAAAAALRAGDPTGLETAVQFLEADPWCFRSGYMKAGLMHRIANSAGTEAHRPRLQDIVMYLLRHPQPRLLPPTVRLAAAVWDDNLQNRVISLAEEDSSAAEQPQVFTRLVAHQIRTIRGLGHERWSRVDLQA
ncbi:hypothetical protein [Frankia gtarii]|uniref:hypothetical protein n=1 Tax=Frankia gtarii TaxID=2950102 RepID=UPI0021C06B11|nr:hypothetical protein [Frankia gtarii]